MRPRRRIENGVGAPLDVELRKRDEPQLVLLDRLSGIVVRIPAKPAPPLRQHMQIHGEVKRVAALEALFENAFPLERLQPCELLRRHQLRQALALWKLRRPHQLDREADHGKGRHLVVLLLRKHHSVGSPERFSQIVPIPPRRLGDVLDGADQYERGVRRRHLPHGDAAAPRRDDDLVDLSGGRGSRLGPHRCAERQRNRRRQT